MVVDTSVVVAIILGEPERPQLLDVLFNAEWVAISAASVLECSIVLRGRKQVTEQDADDALDRFLQDTQIRVEPVGTDALRLARDGHRKFGKGTGHPAQLNFGDCFSYALAKSLDAPLLYKGNDFGKTDIKSAL